MFRSLVGLVLLAAVVCANEQEPSQIGPEPHSSTTVAPTTTTITPKTTTVTPKTTTVAPKTTTVTPKTTTVTPKTTTVTPKTTTVTPKTTTVTPKTTTTTSTTTTAKTTTVVPPTTPKPGPVPVPTAGLWSVNYTDSNRTCLVVRAAIQIEIPLNGTDNGKTVKINLPPHAASTGVCANQSTESLSLKWDTGNSIALTFARTNNGSRKFELEKFEADLNLTLPGATNATVLRFLNAKPLFATPLDSSYKCNKEQTFNLTSALEPNKTAFLYLTDVQFQAFRNATGDKFDSAVDCESATQRDVIPIVVGCVLAALVVLVLVGYLFGRRRCQARGYLSM